MARLSYRDTYLLLDLQLAFWRGEIEATDTRDDTEPEGARETLH